MRRQGEGSLGGNLCLSELELAYVVDIVDIADQEGMRVLLYR